MRYVRILVGCLLLAACSADPPPKTPPPTPSSPATDTPSPTVPPKPVAGQEAFYIIEIPAPVTKLEAKLCKSSAECDALLPPNPPAIARRFGEESWLVVSTPADHVVRSVVSDGTTATATVDQPCAGKASRLVLYRVATTVSKAATSLASKPTCTVD